MSKRSEALDSAADGSPSATTASEPVCCVHCGLPVPAGLIDPQQSHQFCCQGCRAVYQLIHGCGLDRFYRLRRELAAESPPARTTGRRYEEYDHRAFSEAYCQSLDDGSMATELYLEGVHCAACVWLVEKLPRLLPGVIEARLDLRRSLVQVRWDRHVVTPSAIARTLDGLGYPPHPAKDVRARQLRRDEDHRFLIRMGVAAACAGNVMTLAFALYGGVFGGIEAQYSQLFRWASAVFGVISLAWPGSLFFRGAWAALRTRTAHLDVPIALALATGGVAGSVNAVLGRGEIYFDSLTMLVFLLLGGRWIQRRQQRWASDAVELLFSLTPSVARRVEADGVRDVPIEAIQLDDLVEVLAGDSVPTDGVVVEGESDIDQSLITGESRPVRVSIGELLHAGTTNVGARLLLRVTAVGDQTRVGKLVQLVERCGSQRTPIVQLADRIAGWFVAVVLVLAALTFLLWLRWDASHALDHAIAMLIVTCPCGLGLATPLAISVALGRAARRHLLVKGGETLELLARPGRIYLDKTGTLTLGRMTLVHWHGDTCYQPWVVALEQQSSHPIARAIVSGLQPALASAPLPVASSVEQVPGAGIVGRVHGQAMLVGSPGFAAGQGTVMSAAMDGAVGGVLSESLTPVVVAVDGTCVAVLGLGDPLREDAAAAVDSLREEGWDVWLLSGDHVEVVRAVGHRLGVADTQVVAGASPEQKAECVREAADSHRVVMVGDGVNDAVALSSAHVGIAVHGGGEASLAAADVYVHRPGLFPVVELIDVSRRTMRVIHRSLLVSLGYNVVAASLAILGLIGPLGAALLMPLSSFSVVALAFAGRTFGDRP